LESGDGFRVIRLDDPRNYFRGSMNAAGNAAGAGFVRGARQCASCAHTPRRVASEAKPGKFRTIKDT
jgi:hypothetical protein